MVYKLISELIVNNLYYNKWIGNSVLKHNYNMFTRRVHCISYYNLYHK